MPPYYVLLGELTLQLLLSYKSALVSKRDKPGNYLQERLNLLPDSSLDNLTIGEFLQLILSTKKITCFAESEISGDGSDWTATELRILGDVSIAMTVRVFDNGVWGVHEKAFKIHDPPMVAKLVFTPGPLLHGSEFRTITPDLEDIFDHGRIDQEKYNALIKRRLLPVFLYANEMAKQENKKALIVLPGLGCGQFAGKYIGKMGEHLNKSLQAILHQLSCENISCVRFDPFSECVDSEEKINNIMYRVRKNIGRLGKSQLSPVEDYEEMEGEFQNCILYKVVAWDHASLPGNDYFLGSRSTDDGVTAAATDSMEVLTGVKGCYSQVGYFMPPEGTRTWMTVASKNKTKLVVDGNVKVALNNGKLIDLSQYQTGN